MLEKTFKFNSSARLPKAPLSTKSISHKSKPSTNQVEPNENQEKSLTTPSHRHTRSYGRIPPGAPTPKRTSGSPALTPCRALLHMHDQLSQFEYKEITNYKELFYLGSGRAPNESSLEDPRGYYQIYLNDHIQYRYQILQILGQGSFGTVIKCKDHKTDELVAIKVLRKLPKITKSGKEEVFFLDLLKPVGDQETCIVEKIEEFLFRGHFCIVFELLSSNLYDFLKQNHFSGLSTNLARRITTQILIALKHSHQKGVVHCDIKPENVVFKQENKSGVKLVDFGSAWKSGERGSYIQSRFYRAPEVILERSWDERIDIWSLGCVVVEMVTGWPLFMGEDEPEVFRSMVKVLGMPDEEYFKGKIKNSKVSVQELENEFGWTRGKRTEIHDVLAGHDPQMTDFVNQCLKWNRDQRLTPEDGLGHAWIRGY